MSYPGSYTEFVAQQLEGCAKCKKEIQEGETAWADEDGEIVCSDCFVDLLDEAENAWDAYKETHAI